MGFWGDLVKYKPTGAFSIEIRKRLPDGRPSGGSLYEAFFLLPPTEYSIEENSKVTVNRTIGGAWTDDYGPDHKKINISGELYSFYFGVPERKPAPPGAGYLDSAVDALLDIGRDALETAGEAFLGHSGIDEFFMLRYVFSRFREKTPGGKLKHRTQEESALLKIFPKLSPLLMDIENGTEPNNENYAWIYNDYDDGNRYEVVVEKFTSRRAKEDPFTIKYSIEMVGIRPFQSEIRTFGKLGRGIKETAMSVIQGGLEAFENVMSSLADITGVNDLGDALEVARAAAGIPAAIKATFDSFINDMSGFATLWGEFADGVKSDYSVLSSSAAERADATTDLIALYLSASGLQPDAIAAEDAELDEAVMQIYHLLTQANEQLIVLQGLDKYGNNATREKILEDSDTPALRDTDFTTETSGGGSTQSSQNSTRHLQFIYYVVEAGDALDKLAYKFYNDYTLQTVIGQVNELRNIDFHNDALVGKSIKIPLFNAPALTQLDTNLVYSRITQQTKVSERQKQVLGNDIALDTGRGFKADGSGDLAMVSGMDGLVENLLDRFTFRQGILGPSNPHWGFPGIIGQVPDSIFSQKVAQFVEDQLNADPRLLSSYVIISDMQIRADVLRVPVKYTPLTGSEQILDVGKVLPGTFVQ